MRGQTDDDRNLDAQRGISIDAAREQMELADREAQRMNLEEARAHAEAAVSLLEAAGKHNAGAGR